MRARSAVILIVVLAGACACAAAEVGGQGAPVTVTASVEPDTATVGDRLTLTLRVEGPEGVPVAFPDVAKLVAPLEVIGSTTVPSKAAKGRAVEERAYVLSAFETGRARVPAMPFSFVDAKGDSGSVLSDSLAVVVRSVLPAGEEKPQPKDIKPPVSLPRRIWPLLVAAAAVVAAFLAYRRLSTWWRGRRRRPEERVEEPKVPRHAAHTVAFGRLAAIEREDAIGRGEIHVFYVAVTEVLRLYIRDRFGVDAIDMTTSELGPAMRDARMEESDIDWTTEYLAHADLAKFAQHVPTPERAREDFRGAWDFVDRTRFRGDDAGAWAEDGSAPQAATGAASGEVWGAPPAGNGAASGEAGAKEAPRC